MGNISDKCPSGQWECYNPDGTSDCRDCDTGLGSHCIDDPGISCAERHPGTSRNHPGDPATGCGTGWWPCYNQTTGQKYCKACTSVYAGGACQQIQEDVCGGELCPPGRPWGCLDDGQHEYGCDCGVKPRGQDVSSDLTMV